jgi:hypothetical protein
MTLGQIRDLLACEVICGEDLMDMEVGECFAADLMSDVLAFSRSGAVLITGLASIQSVHTADVADLKAIVFVHSKRPAEPVTEVARQQGIPLLTTGRFKLETCGLLFSHGLQPADKE